MKSNGTPSFLEAKFKIESYCAYQERCEKEVRDKLRKWEVYGEQADVIIADLISNQFLNEERFAEAFVSGKIRIKRWGNIKIKQHLKQKQISKYSIDKAFRQIDEEVYLKNLKDLFDKKCRDINAKPPLSWEEKAKIQRYLLSKGYENHLVFELFENSIAKNP